MALHVQNYIGGKWCDGSGGTGSIRNPATEEVVATVTVSTPDDVRAATSAAAAAFPAWREVPAPRRAEILLQAGNILVERKEELARLITQEVGKVLFEARGEVQEAIDMAFYMAGEGRRLSGQLVPSEMPDKWAMAVREPLGVVGMITAFNFPVAVPSWKIFPALVLGNTVVWKPAPITSASAAAFTRCLVDAGLPAGVLNMIAGGDAQVGESLVDDEHVRAISFTGSTAAGRRINERAARQLKRVCLELGGKNATIVLADADLDLAAQAVVWAAFGTSGQRCTSTSRVIVEESVYDAFLERLLARARQLRIGNPLDENVDVGPVINEATLVRCEHYVELARKANAPIHLGGNRVNTERGFYFEPTIIGPVDPRSELAQEEIFGPILSLISVRDFDEAIAVSNGVRYGLSSSIFTQDVSRAFKAMRRLDTGLVYVNHGTTGAEIQLPFGGTKDTGNGLRDAGQAALDTYSEWKSIYVDYSGRLQRAQIDNR